MPGGRWSAGQLTDRTEAHDPDLYAPYLLILHRGSAGEARGLRDEDVDLDAGTLTIIRQLTPVGS